MRPETASPPPHTEAPLTDAERQAIIEEARRRLPESDRIVRESIRRLKRIAKGLPRDW